MAFQVAHNVRFRRNFGRIRKIIDLPYLIEIQKNSYDLFLQKDVLPNQRQGIGLQEVFKSVFPIKDFNETASLEFVGYSLGEPKYDVEECHQRGMTYAAPLKVTVQLVLWDVDPQTGSRTIKNVKEQEVYFGEVPLMTKNGTFMVNGTERVIVSQLHRSPGVFFEHDKGKTHASGKLLYSARVIPYRGSWLDFEFDPRDILYVRIDRRRKFHATVLLRALGMTTEDLLNYFHKTDTIVFEGRKPLLVFKPDHLVGIKAGSDVRDPKSNELIVREGKKFTRPLIRQMELSRIKHVAVAWEDVLGRVAAHNIVDPENRKVLVECNQEITQERLDLIREKGLSEIEVLFIDDSRVGPHLRNTLLQDRLDQLSQEKEENKKQEKAIEHSILEIYRRLRPGDPPTKDSATNFFNNLFFNPDRYDLSKVGRLKLNHRLKLSVPLEQGTLRKEDILEVARYLMELKNGNGSVDDIDHLGNRRVRAVG
ncbi:MAG: DNA-directed RNA polymerase subunit beta, partial [Candidatus Binatota bacterium]